jgi:isopentenyl diphosphate isomerase/L-lactate dehydrogenase-like FMN-dependent dehydrogenase
MRRNRYAARIASKIDSVEAAEHYARARIPRSLSQRIEGGSGTGSCLDRNLAAFERITFSPRVAVSFSSIDLSSTVVGCDVALPVIVAPTGNLRVFHPDAEPGAARATTAAGAITCVSTVTGTAIEEITVAGGHVFFQLYYLGGRDHVEHIIERAKKAGCHALVVTVDTPAQINREWPTGERWYMPTGADLRNFLRFGPEMLRHPRWTWGFLRDGMPTEAPMGTTVSGEPLAASAAVTKIMSGDIPVWEDLPWIQEVWKGPVIVKGILSIEDARRAAAAGAAGIVVSNHGARLFDALPATMDVLPGIVDAVGDEIDVLVDSGVRRGTDIARALAVGAKAVMTGRGYLWAHAAAGEAGITRMLDLFRDELERTLKLIGCPSVAELDRSFLAEPAPAASLS